MGYLRKSSSVRAVNKPISVRIGPVSSFSSIKIYMVENQRNKVRSLEQICFVTKENSKTENSGLPKRSNVSSVNTPISVGIGPVSSLPTITIYKIENWREKVRSHERIIYFLLK